MQRITHPQARVLSQTVAAYGCLLLLIALLAACGPAPASPMGATTTPSVSLSPRNISTPTIPPTESTPSATPTATPLSPDSWKTLPIIPTEISDRVREVYRLGLSLGNNTRIFSRIGDCASAAPGFLTGFDREYNLGEYTYLQPAIDYFQGSFKRPSLAAKAGLNTSGLLTTLWTDQQCQSNETLLDCQYRLDHPSFAIISLGTNEAYYVHRDPGSFERNMRLILDDTLAQGVVPILATKADNVEGDRSINATIARLAQEYQVPLWNFWLAAQPLPKHGMVSPEHLSTISYLNFTDFSIPHSLEYGMQVRNLTALQMFYFLWEQLAVNSPTATSNP